MKAVILNNSLNLASFHVMPGLYCNFYCSHCVNDSGPKQSLRITDSELDSVISDVKKLKPKKLQFTGGEPTFYIDEINEIIKAHPEPQLCEVQITTNGWYANSPNEVNKLLNSFYKLDNILLSYDKFHSSKLKINQIANIKEYANHRNCEFCVSMCLTSPKDAIEAKNISKELNCNFIFQKVEPSGRAKKNKLAYKYPLFEDELLKKQCPNLKTISFIAGKGFSVCCSSLIFNKENVSEFAHSSADKHFESSFFKKMKKLTFGEMAKQNGISTNNISSELSSPCSLCEYIWEHST